MKSWIFAFILSVVSFAAYAGSSGQVTCPSDGQYCYLQTPSFANIKIGRCAADNETIAVVLPDNYEKFSVLKSALANRKVPDGYCFDMSRPIQMSDRIIRNDLFSVTPKQLASEQCFRMGLKNVSVDETYLVDANLTIYYSCS